MKHRVRVHVTVARLKHRERVDCVTEVRHLEIVHLRYVRPRRRDHRFTVKQ